MKISIDKRGNDVDIKTDDIERVEGKNQCLEINVSYRESDS